MPARYRLRAVVNWLTLGTPLGLLVARLAGCRTRSWNHGLYVATGYGLPLPKAAAFTLGSVILLRDERSMARTALLRHEERHATQWALCLGVLGFPLLYSAASLWSLIIARDTFSHNPFERWAGLEDGGYRKR